MNKIHKMFATLLIAAILTNVLPVLATIPPAPAMWPMPQTIDLNTDTTSPGDLFNITIHVGTTAPSYTWQCKVNFNPAHIQAVRADYTTAGKSQFFAGHGSIPVVPTIDNTAGFIVHGESLVGADSVAAVADSTLFWIEFEVVGVPSSGALVSQIAVDTDNSNTFILDPDLNNIAGLGMGSATYTFTWAAPPSPTIKVSPNENLFNDNTQHYIDTTFTDDITVDISAAWGLNSVSTHLSYDSTLLEITDVDFTGTVWGTTDFVNDPGDLTVTVSDPTSIPGGTVIIAHVTFKILKQGEVPPLPAGSFDSTALDLNNYALTNPTGPITPVNEDDGYVRVVAFLFLEPPQLIVSDASMGPGLALGQRFNVTVTLSDLSDGWRLLGLQFRLSYPADLIEPVEAYEGTFLPYWASQQEGSLGTFWQVYFEPDGGYGPHVLVGDMIFPNGTGMWNPPPPEGTGIVAIITFEVIFQSYGEGDRTGALDIIEQLAIGLDNYDVQNIVPVPMKDPVNGTYTIMAQPQGRMIDLYGGAINSNLVTLVDGAFPAPYGGQGLDKDMDLVMDQSLVNLFASVTYNYYGVPGKMVGFQIIGPDGETYANLFALTDENGIAHIQFRMPWPGEEYFGIWTVKASVSVADETITDTLRFMYNWLVEVKYVEIDEGTLNAPQYKHLEDLQIHIGYASYAQQTYNLLLKVHLSDELMVVIGRTSQGITIGQGPTDDIVEKQYGPINLEMTIPKWAYAGSATLHANMFSDEPSAGGAPVTPEFKVEDQIIIQPY